ncbi:MAG: 5-(carboxyamino)imidazole ribonucleotide synthase, partial [Pseudomonadota bacterium]|nr:5-(carboxyamino)imidazole ribonucleotide synthase [Pseudomonadota bacterium]
MTKQAPPRRSGSIIGLLGTGQLGRMLSLAGAQWGFKTHIYGPQQHAPASEVSWRTTTSDYRDEKALTHFAESVDVLTYEFENVPQETANFLSQFVPVRPPVRALDV